MNVADLVRIVTHALFQHGAAEGLDNDSADPSKLIRCFGIGLGLLSMQMDVLKALIAAEQREVTELPSVSGLASQFLEQGRIDRELNLQKQGETFSALLVELWAALISANTPVWLELSQHPALGAQEEEVMKSDCWLFEALQNAVNEVRSGELRSELLPSADNTASDDTLLQQVLAASGVTSKQLNEEGEIVNVPKHQRNHRVEHVVKLCMGLVFREQLQQMQ